MIPSLTLTWTGSITICPHSGTTDWNATVEYNFIYLEDLKPGRIRICFSRHLLLLHPRSSASLYKHWAASGSQNGASLLYLGAFSHGVVLYSPCKVALHPHPQFYPMNWPPGALLIIYPSSSQQLWFPKFYKSLNTKKKGRIKTPQRQVLCLIQILHLSKNRGQWLTYSRCSLLVNV